MKRHYRAFLATALAICFLLPLAACGGTAGVPGGEGDLLASDKDIGVIDLAEEVVPLSSAPLMSGMMPTAPGTAVKSSPKALIDYSNTKDGYVMVKFTEQTSKRLKAQVKGPSGVAYTYNLTVGSFETLPLSDGNGAYQVTVFENVSGTSYATVTSASFTVNLADEFAPFLRPNQYVNYTEGSQIVAVAASVVADAGASAPLDKVEAVYNYVVSHLTYDKEKAKTVQTGYLPVLDTVLAQKKGICFDYAAAMTAMLRAQGVPTKLVVGYSKDIYHAWVNVYTPESGWVDGAIFFNGSNWQLMDPTFASSANQSKEILEYIGNGANYSAKYLY